MSHFNTELHLAAAKHGIVCGDTSSERHRIKAGSLQDASIQVEWNTEGPLELSWRSYGTHSKILTRTIKSVIYSPDVIDREILIC